MAINPDINVMLLGTSLTDDKDLMLFKYLISAFVQELDIDLVKCVFNVALPLKHKCYQDEVDVVSIVERLIKKDYCFSGLFYSDRIKNMALFVNVLKIKHFFNTKTEIVVEFSYKSAINMNKALNNTTISIMNRYRSLEEMNKIINDTDSLKNSPHLDVKR